VDNANIDTRRPDQGHERGGGNPRELSGHPVHSLIAENRKAAPRVRKLHSAARALAWGPGGKDSIEHARSARAALACVQIRKLFREAEAPPRSGAMCETVIPQGA
jgi:hypothetical protein